MTTRAFPFPAVSIKTAVSTVPSWQEVYCARHQCEPSQFAERIFWRTLHRHALPFAPFLLLGSHFLADRELIAGCARARSLWQVRDEIDDYRYHPFNRGWLRGTLALRVSTHRLRRLAREYLPGSNLPSPISATRS